MKTEFKLYLPLQSGDVESGFSLSIIGQAPKHKPYVAVDFMHQQGSYVIDDRDLERFAVNILKALKSKHLKK